MMSLEEAHQRIRDGERERSLLISDPRLDDNQIVFASDAFTRLTGYSREEVVGRNCRFLQGKDTNPNTVRALRGAIERREAITVDILNYKKDGTPFWNRLRLQPLFSGCGEIENFVGIQNFADPSDVRSKSACGFRD